MCNFGPYVGRRNFGKNAEIVRKAAKMKKLSKNREKLGSVKVSYSFIATQLHHVFDELPTSLCRSENIIECARKNIFGRKKYIIAKRSESTKKHSQKEI